MLFFKYIIFNCVRCITMSTYGYNQDDLSYWFNLKKKLLATTLENMHGGEFQNAYF